MHAHATTTNSVDNMLYCGFQLGSIARYGLFKTVISLCSDLENIDEVNVWRIFVYQCSTPI